jgi:hypothetical protein
MVATLTDGSGDDAFAVTSEDDKRAQRVYEAAADCAGPRARAARSC